MGHGVFQWGHNSLASLQISHAGQQQQCIKICSIDSIILQVVQKQQCMTAGKWD